MKKFIIVFIYCLFIFLPSRQQTGNDSALRNDSQNNPDTLNSSFRKDSPILQTVKIDSLAVFLADSLYRVRIEKQARSMVAFQQILHHHPYLPFDEQPVESNIYSRKETDHEALFYFLVVMLLYFACIKFFFSKYIDNLVTLFFRASMRHQQIREQLLQTPLPSLLLNILFVVSGGLYLSLLARYYDFTFFGNFWVTLLYATGFVSGIYLGKFIILKFAGWIFNIKNAADTYIFIVFLVNKMIGIFLLPFVILMAFPNEYLMAALIPLSFIMLIIMLCYRFLNSFRPIRSEIKVNRFHFFLYLCALEIAPLLLIYKVLLNFVDSSN